MGCTIDRTWRHILLIAVAGVGLLQLSHAFVARTPAAGSVTSPCSAWDQKVGATLGIDTNTHAVAPVDDIRSGLQRARANCRAGRIGLAQREYERLLAQSFRMDFGSRLLSEP